MSRLYRASLLIVAVAGTGVLANTLPAPNHSIWFGYHFSDGRYGNFTGEVKHYSNLYVAISDGFNLDEGDWRVPFKASLLQAASDSKDIYLVMATASVSAPGVPDVTWDSILDVVADANDDPPVGAVWDSVLFVQMLEETTKTAAQVDADVATLDSKLTARGLSTNKRVGISQSRAQAVDVNYAARSATQLDFLAIQAFANPGESLASYNAMVDTAKNNVPSGREIVLTMTAYDRNGLFTNIAELESFQDPLYLKAYNDTRVTALLKFNYARGDGIDGGSSYHPLLKRPHWDMAERILAVDIPTPASLDFRSNGFGDALTYNTSSGVWSTEEASGSGVFTTIGTGSWAGGLLVRAANFNGDRFTDAFTYSPTSGAWAKQAATGQGSFTMFSGSFPAGRQIAIADLNGDGLSDVLQYDKASTGAWQKCLTTSVSAFSCHSGSWSPGWDLYPAEFNRDGREDLFLYNPSSGAWFRAFSDAAGGFAYFGGTWSPGWAIDILDLNADGLSDVFVYNPTTGAWFQCINPSSNNPARDFTYFGGTWSPAWQAYSTDMDGDARGDLFLYNMSSGAWFKAINNGAGAFTYYGGSWSPGWLVDIADLNKDRLSDVVLYNATSGVWFQALNTSLPGFTFGSGTWPTGRTVISSSSWIR